MRVFRDPLMSDPAVCAYMDTTLKCPNSGRRRDIAVTITDLELWKKVLAGWGFWQKTKKGQRWKRRNIFDVEGMLTEYERQAQANEIQRKDVPIHNRESVPERSQGRMPEQEMPRLLERQSGWR